MKKNNRNVGLIYMAIGIIGLVVSTQIDNGLHAALEVFLLEQTGKYRVL